MGIPAEKANFEWGFTDQGDVTVQINLPNGEHVISMTIKQSSFPSFRINSSSSVSNVLEIGRLAPIVQPLLDGTQVPVPKDLLPNSPLLQSGPLLKMYTSISGSARFVSLVRAQTNQQLFPPIELSGVSRYGLEMLDVDMIVNVPEVVLDVVEPTLHRPSRIWNAISDFFCSIIFGSVR